MREMKCAVIIALTMVGIIAVQISLTYLFTFRVGEVFSQSAMGALFLYAILRMCRKRREKAAAKKTA